MILSKDHQVALAILRNGPYKHFGLVEHTLPELHKEGLIEPSEKVGRTVYEWRITPAGREALYWAEKGLPST